MTFLADKSRRGLLLPGLDGANPLGFLAALGTLAVLCRAGETQARLGWRRTAKWTPYLESVSISEPSALSEKVTEALRGKPPAESAEQQREAAQREFDQAKKALKDKRNEIKSRRLRGNARQEVLEREIRPLEEILSRNRETWLAALKNAVPRPELAIGKHLDCTGEEFRDHAKDFLLEADRRNRESLDLMANFGSDVCVNEKSERIRATWFCFITGSGHQYFLDTVRQLVGEVSRERIQAALFEPWSYQDEKLSMRWDPLEDRRYALMDRDPTAADNKSRTVWMANLLAYLALVLFPSAPVRKGLATTSWSVLDGMPTFTWPIWGPSVGLDTIRSFLQLPKLTEEKPEWSDLRERGIVALFRTRRIQVGNPPLHKINFSPARSL